MSDVTDLIERLRAMASETDRIHHDRWCKRKDVPIHGYSAEGNLFREAADALERLNRPADDVVREGLADIVKLLRATDQLKANGFASDAAYIALGLLHDTLPKQTDAVEAERERGQREGKAAVCQWLRGFQAQMPNPPHAEIAAMLADSFEHSERPAAAIRGAK